MSKSGVQVSDECLELFHQLKHGKSIKYIVFSINSEKTHIVVEKTSTDSNYEEFIKDLPENDCRYAIYDFEYELKGEGKRKKICFFVWSPDVSPIKSKMLYASSKDALRRALSGISIEVQATDFSEIVYESVIEKVCRRSVG
ncbi:hypothetical protein T552_02622 [Pneumocystis carinii B80]|uniref:Cofilin n=1 Tax=Pneumocystis carinii (strain B80) TaxID=1408658 RepID=A0A0W4ZE34_PNEC8|nr:hypothetical protein T552_02622 [Pneumocystis carinii B80]KTW26613.1 hypothetical protein T552_02622 [Pneumocystis carinii B80]